MAQLLIWFVLLFYVPTLLFRFVAQMKVDLSQRKIANQIEDFFAAALPSLFLNAVAYFVVNTYTLWQLWEISRVLPFLLITDARISPAHFNLIALYYVTLIAVSAASGWIYGYVELRLTRLAPFFDAEIARQRRGELWRTMLWYHDFWAIFFRREKVMLFPWRVVPTWVFVRTTDRLFHGRLENYDWTKDGDIAGILLNEVTRLNTRDEALRDNATVDFAVPFNGTLWIRWSTITDLNAADVGDEPRTIKALIKDFETRREKREKGVFRRWRRTLFPSK